MKSDELKATRIKMIYNGEIYEDFGTVPCTQLYYRKESVDAAIAELKDENERLKRALWLAKALSANHAANFCYYIAHYGKLNKVKKIYQDQDKWDKVEEICIKKAEEYK